MQRTRHRKSVLGDNPFVAPNAEPRDEQAAAPLATSPAETPAPASPRDARPAKAPGRDRSRRPARAKKKKAAAKAMPRTPASPATDGAAAASAPVAAQDLRPRTDLAPPSLEPSHTDVVQALDAPNDDDTDDDTDDDRPIEDERRRRAVEAKIRDLENRLETMSAESDAANARQPAQERADGAREDTRGRRSDGGVLDTAREMLSSDYYLRQWGRIGMRNRSDVVDEFGYDPTYDARVRPALELMYTRYFRAAAEGVEHIPSSGRALIVVNHSGTFPYDGVMLKTAIRKEQPAARNLRWLSEDQVFYLPFVGSFMTRLGSVRACQENAERLLSHDNLVAVFPEGAKGMGRLYKDKYRLQRFGRGGFIRLCLRTATPIVPCVIVGAEESMPLLSRIEYLTGPLGLPYLPITPTFPLLGPLGLVPAPTKWSFLFGPPIQLEGYGPESADDHVLVGRLTERVRATMQGMLDRALSSRRSVWFG